MMRARRQVYFEEGETVYRSAEGADYTMPAKAQHPAPRKICEAVSRIATALNLYIPKNERRAMQRQALARVPSSRVDRLRHTFKRVIEPSDYPE
jgi:hypothetical protein